MKKIILALLITLLAFVSCKKSDSTTPASSGSPVSVTVNSLTNKATAGDQIAFAVNLHSSNNLTTVVVTQSIAGGTATQVNKYDITSKNLSTYADTETYTAPSGVTGPVTYTWTVTDNKNNTTTKTTTITVISPVSVAVNPSTKQANGGDQLTFLVSMSSNNNLAKIVLTQSINGGAATQVNMYDISSKSATTFSYTEVYTVPSGASRPITLTWTISDSKGNNNTATATITQ